MHNNNQLPSTCFTVSNILFNPLHDDEYIYILHSFPFFIKLTCRILVITVDVLKFRTLDAYQMA